jgi:hypothetical protein
VTRPIKRYPAGPVLIKTLGGPKPRPWPELARIMIRQHNDLGFALMTFGPHLCAEEMIRRYKAECKKSRHRYSRDEAIDKAADRVGLDREKLRNWMNRSRRIRDLVLSPPTLR